MKIFSQKVAFYRAISSKLWALVGQSTHSHSLSNQTTTRIHVQNMHITYWFISFYFYFYFFALFDHRLSIDIMMKSSSKSRTTTGGSSSDLPTIHWWQNLSILDDRSMKRLSQHRPIFQMLLTDHRATVGLWDSSIIFGQSRLFVVRHWMMFLVPCKLPLTSQMW